MHIKFKDIEFGLIRFAVIGTIFAFGMWLMAHQTVLSSIVGGVVFGAVVSWLMGGTAKCLHARADGTSYIYIEPMRVGIALYYISIAILLVGMGGFLYYMYISSSWDKWWVVLLFVIGIMCCGLVLYVYDIAITIDDHFISVIHRFPLSSVERQWPLSDIVKIRVTLMNELLITFCDKRKVRINLFVRQNFEDLPEFKGRVRSINLLKLYRLKQEIQKRARIT